MTKFSYHENLWKIWQNCFKITKKSSKLTYNLDSGYNVMND